MNKGNFPDMFNNAVQGARRVFFGPQYVNIMGERYHFDSVGSVLESLEVKSTALIGLSAAFLGSVGYMDFNQEAFLLTAAFNFLGMLGYKYFLGKKLCSDLSKQTGVKIENVCWDKRPWQGKWGTSFTDKDLPPEMASSMQAAKIIQAMAAAGTVYFIADSYSRFSFGEGLSFQDAWQAGVGGIIGGGGIAWSAMMHRAAQIQYGRWRACPPPDKEEKKAKTPVDMMPSAT